MEIKKGISVSPGVVIGTALVLDAEDLLIPKRFISPDQVPADTNGRNNGHRRTLHGAILRV